MSEQIEWRPCVGLPGYEVSCDGRVRSVPRVRAYNVAGKRPFNITVRGVEITPKVKADNGRPVALIVTPRFGKRRLLRYVHRLVLEAFVGPCPAGMECCHNDGDFRNNRVENLRWDTRAGNVRDAIKHGTLRPPAIKRGAEHPQARFSEDDVREMRRLFATGISQGRIARSFSTYQSVVHGIVSGKSWAHI
jgi:hypothetical protein